MTNALAIYKDFDGLQRAAMALKASGYFKDVQSEAQAIVKVMAGSELGLPPFASMAGIHVIQGKPVLGANVIATLVKNDPRYDYRIKQADDKACVLTWYEDGQQVGEAGFTTQEAQNAGLTGKDNWKKYTSDMLFARAISRGARRFAPGIFGGSPVYTPDEMGVDTDEEGYIDGMSITIEDPVNTQQNNEVNQDLSIDADEPEQVTEVKHDFKTRPYDPETLKAALEVRAGKADNYNPSEKQRNLLGALLSEHFQDDTRRYEASEWLFGAASTKEIDGAMVKVALDWLKPKKDDGGAYVIDDNARKELSSVLPVALIEQGQEAFL
jgi:hypothetical protein